MNSRSMFRSLVIAVCTLLAIPGLLHAQSKYFMYSASNSDIIAGGTVHDEYKKKKAAEILSFGLSVSNTINIGSVTGGGAAGKATFDQLTINFIGEPDMMPKIFTALASGQHLTDLVIEETNSNNVGSGKNPNVSLKLDMRLVMFEQLQMSGTQGDRAIYTAVIRFGAMEMTTYKMDNTGKMVPASVARWSVVKNNDTLGV